MLLTNESLRGCVQLFSSASNFAERIETPQAVCWSPAHLMLQDQLRHASNRVLPVQVAQGSTVGRTELLNAFLQI